ncbi:hypothetical protein B0H10DRAFT_1942037 [Mycena sp. CBHHK59/15]|nr:hypothetical protein B0H10DRAFT_1942037 [Mycena sp. CBHHK59/15]
MWATNLSDFSIPPNIFTSMQDYLVLVAKWIEDKVLLGPCYTRACNTIPKYHSLFYGIGVYTIMEPFFMAGHFFNPAFMMVSLHPQRSNASAMQTGYGQFGGRLKLEELGNLDTVWGRDSNIQLFNVFEPTFLAAGLQVQTNLGHLIFGEDAWLSYGGKHCGHDDPIIAVYHKYIKILPSSHFHIPRSERDVGHNPKLPIEQPLEQRPQKKNMRPKAARMISGTEREALFIKNIITTSLGVLISPLEYCGVGHIFAKEIQQYQYSKKRHPTLGKRKHACSDKENNKFVQKLLNIEMGYQRARATVADTDSEDKPAKPKRQRLSADQRLSLAFATLATFLSYLRGPS